MAFLFKRSENTVNEKQLLEKGTSGFKKIAAVAGVYSTLILMCKVLAILRNYLWFWNTGSHMVFAL